MDTRDEEPHFSEVAATATTTRQARLRLCRAWALVQALGAQVDNVQKIGVVGSSANGTPLPDSDLDVDVILRTPKPMWGEEAWAQVRHVAEALERVGAGKVRVRHIAKRWFSADVDDTDTDIDGACTQVDVFVKWTQQDHAHTVTGFGPQGQPRNFGPMHALATSCADPDTYLTPMDLAVLAVKRHVKNKRPGVKSCLVSHLAGHLLFGLDHAHNVRMLWALVVEASVTGSAFLTPITPDPPRGG
jgi:predicted nucleotidyltransferase